MGPESGTYRGGDVTAERGGDAQRSPQSTQQPQQPPQALPQAPLSPPPWQPRLETPGAGGAAGGHSDGRTGWVPPGECRKHGSGRSSLAT